MPIPVRLQFLPSSATDNNRFSRDGTRLLDITLQSLTTHTTNINLEEKCVRFQLVVRGFFGKKTPSGNGLSVVVLERQLNNPIELYLRCRRNDQSFLFSYPDHDGSISFAAAIRPWKPCLPKEAIMGSARVETLREGEEGGDEAIVTKEGCPVLVTLSGVGVKPQNQADSYKYQRRAANAKKPAENAKWKFGFENMWILAPERDVCVYWPLPPTIAYIPFSTPLLSLLPPHQKIGST